MAVSDGRRRAAGETIRKLRNLRGWSEEYVAMQLGISQRQYSRLETGQAELKLSQLDAISGLLGLSTIDLLSFNERILFEAREEHDVADPNNGINKPPLPVQEQYEARIDHLEKEIVFLRKQLELAILRKR